jgi:site-specific recombinase XerD
MPLTDGRRETEDHNSKTAEASKPRIAAHMLRHACGYALANAGHDTRSLQDYLGHENIQHTSQKVPDFRQQVSRIVAQPTFDSGKARGASNIGGLSDTE